MNFYSFAFILFITACILIYFLFPKKNRWCVLLGSSYFFYFINSHWLLLVHMATAVFTWGMGNWIYRSSLKGSLFLKENPDLSKEEKKAVKTGVKKKVKQILTLGIIVDLGILLFLKYWNFFRGQVDPLFSHFGLQIPALDLLLPLGISFYTLQALAYMIDISRGKVIPDKNPFKFMLFMSYFPQIVQGPIARHEQLAEQLYEGHPFDFQRLEYGIQLMLWGWFKKLVIADRIGIAVSNILAEPGTYHGPIVFFGFALYGIQVYTDFSGGMDIARGFSQIIGVELEENFRQPYFSRSIEEFWRRWHITLGGWMRDYVFYPLSLSKTFGSLGRKTRKVFGTNLGKKLPSFLSMFIVYLLVGFWHGSSYKYVAYGLWNGIFIMCGILFAEVYEKIRNSLEFSEKTFTYRAFQMVRTFFIISLGRYFSRAVSFKYAIRFWQNTLIDWQDFSFLVDGTLKKTGLDTANWVLLIFVLMFLFLIDLLHEKGYHIRDAIARQHILFRWLIFFAAILSILVFGIYGPGYDAASFIYEQF